MIGCFLLGFLAHLPMALSTGMIGTRYWLVKIIPEPIRIATPAGVGAFLAFIGFQSAEGLGVVVANTATAVTLGACPQVSRTLIAAYDEFCATQVCIPGSEYVCNGGVLTSATTWLGLVGLFITAMLLSYRRKGAFVVGILFVAFISWFRNTAVTYFPYTEEGNARFAFFSQIVALQPVNLIVGVVDEEGNFPRSIVVFSVDGVAVIVAACFGLSHVTAYIESVAGVEVGERTGLTAVVVGFSYFLAIFFSPLLASIPPWATGGTLVIVGALMSRSLVDIKRSDPPHTISAFITVMLMPLTYSIAHGLVGGMMAWILLQAVFFIMKKVFKIERYKSPTFELREIGMPPEQYQPTV